MGKNQCLLKSFLLVLLFSVSIIAFILACFSDQHKYIYLSSGLLIQIILFFLLTFHFTRKPPLNHKANLVYQAIEAMADGLLITDSNNVILYSNPSVSQITHFSTAELTGNTPQLFSSGKQSKHFYENMYKSLTHIGNWQGTVWNRNKEGELYAEWLSITTVPTNGNEKLYVASFRDMTEQTLEADKITQYAYTDVVTQLPNRRLLMERLQQTLALAERAKFPFYLIYIDVDDFKLINDTFGHDIGDEYLYIIGQRLLKRFRKTDTVSRYGGDEFVILMPLADDLSPKALDQFLNEALGPQATISGNEIPVQCSYGVVQYPIDGTTADTLIEVADVRMYDLKREHKMNKE